VEGWKGHFMVTFATLFEEHCELSLYSPCPKLTRSHITITPFGCMKVNMAAQVLSLTVANALEMLYGDNISETVNFLRVMNQFFDHECAKPV
jgi:hypothetical protein